jgi:hypothetical protein
MNSEGSFEIQRSDYADMTHMARLTTRAFANGANLAQQQLA